jgi:hypothetical protein
MRIASTSRLCSPSSRAIIGPDVANRHAGGQGFGGGLVALELGGDLIDRGRQFGERAGRPGGVRVLAEGGLPCGDGRLELCGAAGGVLLGGVGHGPVRIVRHGRVGVERVETEPGPHVAEEVLLAPPVEHRPRDRTRIIVGAGGDDRGLVAGVAQPDDLAAREVPAGSVGAVAEPDSPVREPVGVGGPTVIDDGVLDERCRRLTAGRVLAVGEDVEPGRVELGEQFR